jgi:predicted PurR-regulated permease PerM
MTHRRMQNAFFIGLVLLTTLAFLGLVRNYLQPIFWAAVLTITFQPAHRWWTDRVGGRAALAAVLTMITIVVIVILPLFGIGAAVAREASALYDRIASGELNLQRHLEAIQAWIPAGSAALERVGLDPDTLRTRLSNAAVGASRALASQAWSVGQNVLRFSIDFFLLLYLLFFFLRDGQQLLASIIRVLPFGDDRERRLFSKFAEVARATLRGTLVVGIVQGGLGGIVFWLLGIEGAILWGVVMTLLSFLPAVGAAVVWVPTAAVLFLTGAVAKGIFLVAFGTFIIGLADNVLRPILVGRDTQMPDYLVLLATLGGITLFGISGFVIGPVIAALFLTVWDMFGREFGTADQEVAKAPGAAMGAATGSEDPASDPSSNGPPTGPSAPDAPRQASDAPADASSDAPPADAS